MDTAPAPSAASPVPVLITRPQGVAEALADALRQAAVDRGVPLDITLSPILDIRYFSLSTSIDSEVTLILSSAQAVAALVRAGQARGQRAFCVGKATAEAARKAGLAALSADGDAAALAALVRAQHGTGPLVWLRGAHVRGDLMERLHAAGKDVTAIPVYDQVEKPLSTAALDLLRGWRTVLLPLYSPRSAALLGSACAGATAPLALICISDAAAQNWTGPKPVDRVVAAHPDGAAMIDALLCRAASGRSG